MATRRGKSRGQRARLRALSAPSLPAPILVRRHPAEQPVDGGEVGPAAPARLPDDEDAAIEFLLLG